MSTLLGCSVRLVPTDLLLPFDLDTHIDRVIIVTGLRIHALNAVSSADFTYSRGYLALLSVLGALISIIACCARCIPGVMRACRNKYSVVNSIWARVGTVSRPGWRTQYSRTWYGISAVNLSAVSTQSLQSVDLPIAREFQSLVSYPADPYLYRTEQLVS